VFGTGACLHGGGTASIGDGKARPPRSVFMLNAHAVAFLDDAHAQFHAGDVASGMTLLHDGLHRVRRALPQAAWQKFGRTVIREHPVKELLHRDWFTRRAFEKPRGYAGDAELLDFLYQESVSLHEPGCIGGAVGRFMHQQTSAQSVRARRDLVASYIDQVAAEQPKARVLSIACGHLREGQRSNALVHGELGVLVAFDQDGASLAEVQRDLGRYGVETVRGSVRDLLTGKARYSDFDLVYSAGLYDYLAQNAAARLTRILFGMLRPRGRLLVANFGEHPPESGYMETFMDWWLIHRSAAQMEALRAEIPDDQLLRSRHFYDEHQNVIYLELQRR
jgi:extracellular factor (EF) 3-hydroxypalmitic acid methyl ester biosynthesis protein